MTPSERLVYAAAYAAAVVNELSDPTGHARDAIYRLRSQAKTLRLEPDSMLSEFLAGDRK
jgi:hypothetical protein